MSSLCESGAAITSPEAASEQARLYLNLMLAQKEQEVFVVMFLDSQNCLIDVAELFRGTIDGASVYPREVVKAALAANAAAVIVAHNHPSGSPKPSSADKLITQRLQESLRLVDVRVLDHIVVGKELTFSFASAGLIG
ncbi:RadC family protein [Cellvibrio sp. ARAG 10.3]|uniref:RadC family protein n=1 Tax=Cellvibrio sp. ARAG 10.3 TaxID=3451358 RepID=UPI003F4827D1